MVRAVSKYSLLSILASTIPVRLAQRRRTTINHRGTDRTIAQTFISALHLFETMILRFRIDHLRASRVVGRATGRSASPPTTDILSPASHVRKMPLAEVVSDHGEGFMRFRIRPSTARGPEP